MTRKSPPVERRGMLLLLVVLMLSLFMGAGAILMTIAARARAAARANAAATQQTATSDALARDALDQALLSVLRGAMSGTNGSVALTGAGSVLTFGTATFVTTTGSVTGTTSGTTSPIRAYENLLADKYGDQITGTGSITSGINTPVITLSLTSLLTTSSTAFSNQSSRLNGRVLTINPAAGLGDVASFRILGATGTTGITTCYVAQLPSSVQRSLPAPGVTFPVVINGREFTPAVGLSGTTESYDAYDDANDWLAHNFGRNSFGTTYTTTPWVVFVTGTPYLLAPIPPATVDNDNDGRLDGVWLPPDPVIRSAISFGSSTPPPYVIPDQPSPLGGTIRYQVSYLILDLDGRININAAGIATGTQGSYAGTPNTPIGMGYGPADIAAPLLLPPTLPASTGTYASSTTWQNITLSGTPTTTPASPSDAQRRSPPLLGRIDGRSGANGVPGVSGDDAAVNQQTTTTTNAVINATTGGTNSMYTMTIGGQNAVGDLKAQTRVYMTAPSVAGQVTPNLNFYRPSWTGTAGADGIDDPYEARLDADAPRFSLARRPTVSGTVNDDNVFTLAELERILRPNDPDTSQLPQRLAAGLEDMAQNSRMMITTDSWSTPGLTGLAARQIEDFIATKIQPFDSSTWMSGSSVVSPDVAAGLRFNINRPVLSGTTAPAVAQQQEYCKGLYTLVVALSGTANPTAANAAEYAQWAVNVLDFRDADSIMTRFAYDTNLADGWQVDASSPVVYGAERPDVVITETGAWRDTQNTKSQLFVTLHRPIGQALLITGTGGSPTPFGVTEENPLATSGTLPLAAFQLRFGANNVVQFRNVGSSSGTTQWVMGTNGSIDNVSRILCGSGTSPAAALTSSGSGSYVCVSSTTPDLYFSPTGIPIFTVDQGSFRFPATTASDIVYLERLSNPSQSNSAINPYIVVDNAVVSIANVGATPAQSPATRRRQGPTAPPNLAAFWKQQTPWVSAGNQLGIFAVTGTNPVAWFHWPNRPFISQAELALVPTGTASTDGMLANYSFPTNSLVNDTTPIPITSSTIPLGALVLDATYVPSRFAENAVTVADTSINSLGLDKLQANHFSKWREPGRVNVNTIASGSVPPADTVVWAAITGDASTPKPFASATTPAQSPSQILSLSGSAGQPISFQTFASGSTFDPQDKNPYFSYARAIRLANTTTTQSNVFAIWITVKITDDSANAPSPVTRRLFAIIDRSIPVGYIPNKDLNVRDTIKLKRYLD